LTITGVNPPIVIQPPRRFQRYVWLYSGALGAFCVLFLVEGFARGATATAIAFVPLGGLIALGIRAMRLSAIADNDALIVCNWLSTHRYSRSSIREFRMGGSILGVRRNAIQLVTADGASIPISASISPWYLITREQQAQSLLSLQSWLRGTGRTHLGTSEEQRPVPQG
jgi:hypothetical protein